MNCTKIFSGIFLSLSLSVVAQPPRLWTTQIIGGGVRSVQGVQVDQKGSAYIFGSFTGTVDFDPSSAINSLSSVSPSDLYLLKLSPAGAFMWVKRIGPNTNMQNVYISASTIKCDSDTNVYLSGRFSNIIDFDPGINTFTMTAPSPISSGDAFILKTDSSGNFKWAKKLVGNATVREIAIGDNGSAYATGTFKGSVDFNPDTSATTIIQTGGTPVKDNAFLLKLTRNGIFKWIKVIGGNYQGQGLAVAFNQLNMKCCFTGFAAPGADIDPGPSTNVTSSGAGFICELDTMGATLQSKSLDGNCYPTSIKYDSGLLIGGLFQDVVDVDPGTGVQSISCPASTSEIFILKLTNALAFNWVREVNSNTICSLHDVRLMTDKKSHIYLFSAYTGSYDLDPSNGVFNVSSTQGQGSSSPTDYLAGEYDSAGNFLWGHTMGPCWLLNAPGYATFDGDIYLSSIFNGTIDVDPGQSTFTVASSPATSVFVERLTACQGVRAPKIGISAPLSTLCAGQSVSLVATGGTSFQWSHGPLQQSISVSPTVSQVYHVMGKDSSGCVGFASYSLIVASCTGFIENMNTGGGIAYPNPTGNVISFKESGGAAFTVVSSTGLTVIQGTVPPSGEASVDFSSLKPDIYTIVTRMNGKVRSQKIIRQ